jgi:hypothetical protein
MPTRPYLQHSVEARGTTHSLSYSVTLWPSNLKLSAPAIYKKVFPAIERLPDGRAKILLGDLDEETRNELLRVTPLVAKMIPPDSLEANLAINQAETNIAIRQAEERNRIAADKAAAQAAIQRLNWYEQNHFLLPSDSNVAALKSFINSTALPENLRGKWTPQTVDIAVSTLSAQKRLQYVTLSDGSRPLPDGTVPNSRHTIAQLRDLDQRQRSTKPRPAGVFGTKF